MKLSKKELKDIILLVGGDKNSEVQQYIVALAFAAECDDAKECACLALSTFLSELNNPDLFPLTTDKSYDALIRLRPLEIIYLGYNGNKFIVDKGMSVLGMVSIGSYKKDKQKYPKITMDMDVEEKRLLQIAKRLPNSLLDTIIPPDMAPKKWWN